MEEGHLTFLRRYSHSTLGAFSFSYYSVAQTGSGFLPPFCAKKDTKKSIFFVTLSFLIDWISWAISNPTGPVVVYLRLTLALVLTISFAAGFFLGERDLSEEEIFLTGFFLTSGDEDIDMGFLETIFFLGRSLSELESCFLLIFTSEEEESFLLLGGGAYFFFGIESELELGGLTVFFLTSSSEEAARRSMTCTSESEPASFFLSLCS